MPITKQKFLLEFCEFLETKNHGKCFFEMKGGVICQGWISEVGDTTFEYHDSGPEAREKPYVFDIANIDVYSFAYWDDAKKHWVDYPSGRASIHKTKLNWPIRLFRKVSDMLLY